MNERTVKPSRDSLEQQLERAAHNFVYPPTPNLLSSGREQGVTPPTRGGLPLRPWVWAAVIALFILTGLLIIPPVRAAVVEFLQVGAIRIFLAEPTPTPTPEPELNVPQEVTPGTTPQFLPTPVASVLNLAGETTLAEAQRQIDFTLRLPAGPLDLGPPDKVFLQDLGGSVVVLVWLDPVQPEQVRLSLHQLGPGTLAQKGPPTVIEETTVHGQQALWTTGPYILEYLRDGQKVYDLRQLVAGKVLIWTENEITYRLETRLPLSEAVRVAESLRDFEVTN